MQVIALNGLGEAHLVAGRFAVRPPRIGDVGVVVEHVPSAAPSAAMRYVVEGGERGAAWSWLATFAPAELAPTEPPL